MRSRFWSRAESAFAVHFRTDLQPMIWVHTMTGWLPVANTPHDVRAAESFAEGMAREHELDDHSEISDRVAWIMSYEQSEMVH